MNGGLETNYLLFSSVDTVKKSFESFYRTVNQRRWMTVSNQNGNINNNFNKYISTYAPKYMLNELGFCLSKSLT